MATIQQEPSTTTGLGSVQHHSKIVQFAKEVAREASDETPTSVEIFSDGGNWYCRVRRGDEKTRPMGPYTKQQAQRIQEARRLLIAKRGIARIIFE